jgi:hypothetical protein
MAQEYVEVLSLPAAGCVLCPPEVVHSSVVEGTSRLGYIFDWDHRVLRCTHRRCHGPYPGLCHIHHHHRRIDHRGRRHNRLAVVGVAEQAVVFRKTEDLAGSFGFDRDDHSLVGANRSRRAMQQPNEAVV